MDSVADVGTPSEAVCYLVAANSADELDQWRAWFSCCMLDVSQPLAPPPETTVSSSSGAPPETTVSTPLVAPPPAPILDKDQLRLEKKKRKVRFDVLEIEAPRSSSGSKMTTANASKRGEDAGCCCLIS